MPAEPRTKRPELPELGDKKAFSHVAEVVWDSARSGPSLAVWLFDRTESSFAVTQSVAARILSLYETLAVQVPGGGALKTAVIAFGADVQLVVEEPTSDLAVLEKAFHGLSVDESGKEVTFAAIRTALDRYESYRLKQNQEVMLIVVTDEAGDDESLADALVPRVTKLAIPVYVIGAPAPFGRVSVGAQFTEGPVELGEKITDVRVRQGPESRQIELVTVNFLGNAEANPRSESGFGPFGLECLSRAAGGAFWRLRAPPPDPRRFTDVQHSWPSPDAIQFSPEAMRAYTPEYVSAAEYEQLAAANRARRAVLNAAHLSGPASFALPKREFEYRSEADLSKRLSEAQQLSARLQPQIDAIYEELKAGEQDREKLSQARWQAAYDLALGRILAAKVRIDGYNSQLAALKRGRRFEKAESKRWLLELSETVSGGSSLEKMADRARRLLQNVSKQHAGTPWAELADRELKSPMGWRWDEK